MLPRTLITIVVWMVVASPSLGEDAPAKTSIRLYKVADLVSNNLSETVASQISLEEWRSENKETIQALDRLASLVKAMSSTELSRVEPYPATLSLVIRHTAEGHREIDEMLELLRKANEPTIQLTCELIDVSRLKSLPEDQVERIQNS